MPVELIFDEKKKWSAFNLKKEKIVLKKNLIYFFTVVMGVVFILGCSNTKIDSNVQKLENGWYIKSAEANAAEEIVKEKKFNSKEWYPATVPGTVLAVLIENGEYEDPNFGRNLEKIPSEPFDDPWWYRKSFKIDDSNVNMYSRLIFEGINYSADIWLNGKKIASADSLSGAFRMFEINVSNVIRKENLLLVKVYPPEPGDFTIGFVDWNPAPPDDNMGIWRSVKLRFSKSVSINKPFVRSRLNLKSLDEAWLSISADLTNHTDKKVAGQIKGKIENIVFSCPYKLNPFETKKVYLSSDKIEELHIRNPRIWWPNNLGKPNLYILRLKVIEGEDVSDVQTVRFGIREVSDYKNENGYRGYRINGKKVLIKGGGWVDDMLLREERRKIEAQIKYTKHINLNTIRLEGFWGASESLYDLADENGILIMPGWSCQWEWSDYLGKKVDKFGGIITPEEMNIVTDYLHDQVVWLRNHPSIFVWVLGSDMLPRPALEIRYYSLLSRIDPTRPTLASCTDVKSEISGHSGVKMNGPYDYVPPIYWYEDKEIGGAYGFNTETGPGPQPPPLESFKKMIPEENLWPKNDMWNYHCGRNKFDNIERYYEALNKRYGKSENLDEFLFKAQMANYEAMRGMYESFAVNRPNTTGIIQWMLNSAWAEMYWQLYDWYLMPSGAFYGARTAFEPLNIAYNYKNRSVYIVNEKLDSFEDLVAEVKVLTHKSEVKLDRKLSVSVAANKSKKIFSFSDEIRNNELYFIDLRLKDKTGSLISNNFYWLSSKEDVMDYNNSLWFVTPTKEFADFKLLNSLPTAEVQIISEFKSYEDKMNAFVTLENTSDKLAFFIELKLIKENSGEFVLPVFWEDNYVSLLPGETRKISCKFSSLDLKGEKPVLQVQGWNLAE